MVLKGIATALCAALVALVPLATHAQCGDVRQPCCPGNTCNPGLTCIAGMCTTVIHVETEGSGVIIQDNPTMQNANGAMVWNGAEWVVNNTWAHKFFMDTRTGQRLKDYNTQTVNGTSPTGNVLTHQNYEVTRNIYTYSKPAANGSGTYTYQAVEYVTHDTATGHDVILRSRGTGNGTASPYFDVYIQDEVGTQTTAFRGDPVWYTYPMVPSAAVNQTDATAYRTGDFPSVNAGLSTDLKSNGYYLDIANGADLGPGGVGKSYEFICDALTNRTTRITSSYAVQFMLKWMDSSGNLQMISYSPSIVSEDFAANPVAAAPAMTASGLMVLLLLIVIVPAWRLNKWEAGTRC